MANVSVWNYSRREQIDVPCGDGKCLKTLFEFVKDNNPELLGKSTRFEDVQWHEDDDGTIVDDDEYLALLPDGTVLMGCVKGKETWTPQFRKCADAAEDVPDGAKARESTGDAVSEEDQKLYVQTIEYMLGSAGKESSGQDEPDGKGFDLESGLYLLCDAKPESLAQHLGLSKKKAEDLQLEATVALYDAQTKRDLAIYEKLQQAEKDCHSPSSTPYTKGEKGTPSTAAGRSTPATAGENSPLRQRPEPKAGVVC